MHQARVVQQLKNLFRWFSGSTTSTDHVVAVVGIRIDHEVLDRFPPSFGVLIERLDRHGLVAASTPLLLILSHCLGRGYATKRSRFAAFGWEPKKKRPSILSLVPLVLSPSLARSLSPNDIDKKEAIAKNLPSRECLPQAVPELAVEDKHGRIADRHFRFDRHVCVVVEISLC